MRRSTRMMGITAAALGMMLAATGEVRAQLFGRERQVVVGSPYGAGATTVVVSRPRVTLKPVFDPIRDALSRLKSDHNRSRRDGALTLGQIGDPRAVPDLVWMLQNDRDREVREAAALSLGAIGDARALGALRVASLTDRNRHVRQAAHHAHGKILFDAPIVESATVIETVPPAFAPTPIEIAPAPSSIELEPELQPQSFEPTTSPAPTGSVRGSEILRPSPLPLPLPPPATDLPAPLPPPATDLPRATAPADPEPALDAGQAGEIPPGPLSAPLPPPAP